MGQTLFHGIFLDSFHIHIECGKDPGIFFEISIVPQNIGMDLNNVMERWWCFFIGWVVVSNLVGPSMGHGLSWSCDLLIPDCFYVTVWRT